MLTDAKIKAAKAKDRPYKLADSGRLYLQVQPTGNRLWRMNYKVRSSPNEPLREKTLALGAYPAVTLVQARRKRDDAKDLLATGVDPGEHKKLKAIEKGEVQAATFEAVARQWWGKQKVRWSKVHASDVLKSLEENIFPALGAVPIATIKAPRLLEVLSAVEDRGAIETAHRIRARVSNVFVYAIVAGLAEHDPAGSLGKALTPKPRAKRQPAIVDLDKVRQMVVDCEGERCRAGTKLALRFLALTAVRPNELHGARWSEIEGIDWSVLKSEETPLPQSEVKPLWRIPAARMKGDDERKAEDDGDHLVPLAPQAVDILRVLHRLSGDLDLVFPSERHSHRPISENTLRALLIRAGYYQRHVPHGFRAAFSTVMNERAERAWRAAGHKDASPDRAIIDLMLAHKPKDKVEGAYNRAAYLPRRRELACEWADLLLADFWPPEVHLGQPVRYAATGAGRP